MGTANAVKDENGKLSNAKSRRVEIHVLRNDSTEVASNLDQVRPLADESPNRRLIRIHPGGIQ